jgi:hypothetical protein
MIKFRFILHWFSIVWGGLSMSCTHPDAHWTHFRGSHLDGIAYVSACPANWNPDTHIVWKKEIHGRGWSSPVVLDNQIWLTTATPEGDKMYAISLDLPSGDILFDILLFTPDSIYRKHDINSYATPTPCIEKNYVYVHFGRYGTACLSTRDGSTIWKREDLSCSHVQGPGSSPILYKNLLILHLEGTDRQIITALDKATGETVWETERPAEIYRKLEPIGRKAYITPIVTRIKGKNMLISNGSAACIAYDPDTGKEIWRIVRGEDSTIAMPFAEAGIVYFYTGFITTEEKDRFAELISVNPDGEGDIGEKNIRWRIQSPILQLSTPVIKDGLIYTVDTKSRMMCINAKSGETVWSHRVKGKYNSSPVYADGKIYFSSTNGKTIVIREGPELNIISENKLEGEIWTTPAIIQNSMIIRTSAYLYRIGK